MYDLLCEYFSSDAVEGVFILLLAVPLIGWRIAVALEGKSVPGFWKTHVQRLGRVGVSFGILLTLYFAYAQQKEEQQQAQQQAVVEVFTSISEALSALVEPFTNLRNWLTPEEKKSRLLPVGLATNDTAWVAESQCVTSQVREAWQRVPIRRAAFRQTLPFPVTIGDNSYEEVFISSSGVIGFDAPKGSELTREMPYEEAADHVYLALLWGRIDFKPRLGSKMWCGVKEDGNFVASYDTVFIDGDTNAIAKVQVEFIANGDMILRYADLPPCATNSHVAGFQNLDGGWSLPFDNIRSNTALYLKSFGPLDLTVEDSDTDGDGISDYYELYPTNSVSLTDPCNPDSDGDGLMDGEEVFTFGTDPGAFSSDASGTGDLWRVLGGLGPSDAPFTNATPSGSLGILTITTVLEGLTTNGGAVLRIADQYIPVLFGTTLVSRIAVPREATNLFILARGANCDNAITHITVEASTFTKIRDPSGVFGWSFTLSPSCVTASGSIFMPSYTITPSLVCFHSPTSSVCQITSADPDIYFVTTQGFVREYTPTAPYIPPNTFTNGTVQIQLASMDAALFTRASVTNIPAHLCNPDNGFSDEYPDGESYSTWCKFQNGVHVWADGYGPTNCPCLVFTNAFACICSGDGRKPCECAHAARDPKAMPPNADQTNVLGHAALVIGGTNDLLDVTVPEGTYRPCPQCACASVVPSSASVYRQTSCIEVTPSMLTADGAFSVAGISPSTNFADTVFMYKEADYSGSTAVTSYTRKDYTVLGTSVYPTDPGHSVSNWFVGCNVTNELTLWTGVKLPSGTGEVTLSVTVDSGAPAPLLYVYNRVSQRNDLIVTQWLPTFTQNLGDWRNAYCDTNGYAQVYLLCASGGVARVTHSFSTYSGQPYTLSCNTEQKLTACKVKKLPLGSSLNFDAFEVGKVYVPTKWGGKLTLGYSECELFYTDGSDLDALTAKRIAAGECASNRIAQGFPCEYVVPTNQFKWFYFRVLKNYNQATKATFTQSKTVSKVPWSCPWYPMADAQAPNLYDNGGALDIYDAAFNSAARAIEKRNLVLWEYGHFANSNLLLEADAERTIGYDFDNADSDNNIWTGWDPFVNVNVWASVNSKDISWFGHCDIASAVIICEDAPTTPYTVPGTTNIFSADQQKGLLVALYHGYSLLRSTGWDVKPHLWHSFMETRILGENKMFASDIYNDTQDPDNDQVWNYPIYEITEANYIEKPNQSDEKAVEIKSEVKYWDGRAKALYYWYALTYDEEGNADNSFITDWNLTDPRAPDDYHRTPDRAWIPHVMTSVGTFWDGNLDYTTIRTIVPLSTP
jgi:hypothetical protein